MKSKSGIQLENTKRHSLIGTEVRGVDLSRHIDDATYQALHDLWMEHL
ncbi:uncharacterized protein METZ01_LOCUS279193, partial [marine metagenome]